MSQQTYPRGPYVGPPERWGTAMASWALALALLICVPLAPLVGAALGIGFLTGHRRGEAGWGRAVAAVVIGSLVLVLIVVGIALNFVRGFTEGFTEGARGPQGDRDGTGAIVSRSEAGIDHLQVGDCLLALEPPAGASPDAPAAGVVTAVLCTERRRAEVYAIHPLDPDDYGTQRAVENTARDLCVPGFREYVGISYRRSRLELYFYYYSRVDIDLPWALDAVTCLVDDPAGPTRRPVADSRR